MPDTSAVNLKVYGDTMFHALNHGPVKLDTVDQGLFTVDLQGAISTERSARIDTWFGRPAAGAKLWKLFPELGVGAELSFEMGWGQIAEDCLPIEAVLDQLPKRIASGAVTFELRYLPIGDDPVSRRILVVITDVSALVTAERLEAVQRDLLRAIERSQRDRAGVVDFLRETDALIRLLSDSSTPDVDRKRHVHTLKDSCRVFGIQSVAARCHAIESRLAAEERSLSDAEHEEIEACWADVREGIASLLGDTDSALAVSRDQFLDALDATLSGEPPGVTAARLADWVLTPLEVSFARLGEQARSLATRLGKEVGVVTDGGGIGLDNEQWGPFWAAFPHAIRNAVDHGVERPEDRVASGKRPNATLVLSAKIEDSSLVIEVADDGRGIAWGTIRERLRERGISAATSEQLIEGLFGDGLSTVARVSEISGRGIGMGALRAAVQARGGRIEVRSESGAGTTLRCVFPAACASVSPAAVLKRELARQAATGRSSAKPAAALLAA